MTFLYTGKSYRDFGETCFSIFGIDVNSLEGTSVQVQVNDEETLQYRIQVLISLAV